jgi:8-oxo-(d)GTP phosphatase
LCTHRPVLPVVLDALSGRAAREGRDAVLAALPRKDPYLKPGGMIVAQRAVDAGGRIVSLEVYDVWDD